MGLAVTYLLVLAGGHDNDNMMMMMRSRGRARGERDGMVVSAWA